MNLTDINKKFDEEIGMVYMQDLDGKYLAHNRTVKNFYFSQIRALLEGLKMDYAKECDKLDEVDERAKITNRLNENMVFGYNMAVTDLKDKINTILEE